MENEEENRTITQVEKNVIIYKLRVITEYMRYMTENLEKEIEGLKGGKVGIKREGEEDGDDIQHGDKETIQNKS